MAYSACRGMQLPLLGLCIRARHRELRPRMPGNASDAVHWLTASQSPLTEALASIPEEGLDDLRLTNWGERIPARSVFTILINEQVHHGAEISLLRDLYRNRETLGRFPP